MDLQLDLMMGAGNGRAALVAPAISTITPAVSVYDGVTPVDITVAASGSPTLTYQWYSRPRGRVVTIDNVGGYDENATTIKVVDATGVGITDIMVRDSGEVMDALSKGTGGEFDVTRAYVGTASAIADGEELGHYDLVPDETSTTLSVQPSEHTDYVCIVSNGVGRAISNVARVILALDTASFTGFYDGETASLTLTGSDIDSYLSVGSVATNCALLSGGKNTQVANQLNGHPISRRTTGADNWYRASANADTVITEEEGFFAFAVKPSTVAAINTLWAMETPSRGKVSVRDVSGTTKARVALGTGGAASGHNHDGTYAAAAHNHDSSYAAKDLFARVTGSNATTTGQALADIAGLSIALAANSTYQFEAVLMVQSSSTAGNGYGVQFSAAGATIEAQITGTLAAATQKTLRIAALNTAASPFVTSGATGGIYIAGMITVGANAGNLTIRHLKVTSGTSTVFINSFMTAIKRA